MPTEFWWGNLKERDHSEDFCMDGRIIIKWMLKNYGSRAGRGFIRLRIGAKGRLLFTG